ncbi:MAG: DUF4760 domain-containing protein [Pseudomonadota bacterium]
MKAEFRSWHILLISSPLLVIAGIVLTTYESFEVAVWIPYGGAWLTVLTVYLRTANMERTRTQDTLSTLQSLRTNPDYLRSAAVLKEAIGPLGTPIGSVLQEEMRNEQPTRVDSTNPDFNYAAHFVLNQYEFIAAATRLGSMDKALLRETIRSILIGLAGSFQDVIHEIRQKDPSTWENFVWLYAELRDGKGPDPGLLDPGPVEEAWYRYRNQAHRVEVRATK